MSKYSMDAKKVIDTLKKHILVDGFHLIIDLQKSHGSRMVDAATGKEYLDFYTYFASLPVGHNHPKVVGDMEFQEALKWAAIANPANSDIYCKEYGAFVKRFAELVKPSYMKYLFFVAGGGLAVENCLKAAFDWKVRRNRAKGIKGEKGQQVLHFREAFHGRTGYTMSLTNTDPTKTDLYPKFGWPRIVNPKLSFPLTPKALSDVEKVEKQAVAEIKKACRENRNDIACLIIESIQGEGGDNHFRREFFQKLRELADENEFLFICDEVQSGMGVTGKMWACEHHDVKPDLIAFGKKAQVCGVMCSGRIDEVEENVFRKSSRINSTWGGNLVDMIRGVKYAEIMKEEKLVQNAAKVGDYFIKRLEGLAAESGGLISNVRGKGLFIAFDMPDTATRNAFRTKCWDQGLATLTSGTRSIRFRGCLNLSRPEVDEAIGLLERNL